MLRFQCAGKDAGENKDRRACDALNSGTRFCDKSRNLVGRIWKDLEGDFHVFAVFLMMRNPPGKLDALPESVQDGAVSFYNCQVAKPSKAQSLQEKAISTAIHVGCRGLLSQKILRKDI